MFSNIFALASMLLSKETTEAVIPPAGKIAYIPRIRQHSVKFDVPPKRSRSPKRPQKPNKIYKDIIKSHFDQLSQAMANLKEAKSVLRKEICQTNEESNIIRQKNQFIQSYLPAFVRFMVVRDIITALEPTGSNNRHVNTVETYRQLEKHKYAIFRASRMFKKLGVTQEEIDRETAKYLSKRINQWEEETIELDKKIDKISVEISEMRVSAEEERKATNELTRNSTASQDNDIWKTIESPEGEPHVRKRILLLPKEQQVVQLSLKQRSTVLEAMFVRENIDRFKRILAYYRAKGIEG